MATKIPSLITPTVPVIWAHLHRPDTNFGPDSANHNITIEVDDDLYQTLEEIRSSNGAAKINGFKNADDNGPRRLKVKSKVHVEGGANFPCVDASNQDTDACPFGGDKVRVRLAPRVLSRDNSMSFYLNGVQIIEKNSDSGGGGGFDAVEGGFDGSNYTAPAASASGEEDDDIPF